MVEGPESVNEMEVQPHRRYCAVVADDQLTPELMRMIIETYYASTGAGERTFDDVDIEMYFEQTREMLEHLGCAEWRFGSRLSPHSKLWIEKSGRRGGTRGMLDVFVDPNMDGQEEGQEQLRRDFYEALEPAL